MDGVQDKRRHVIGSLEELSELYKKPAPPTLLKQTDCITPPGRALIAASPLIMMATAGPDGVDCSPKGDAPGFVQVLDDRTLLIPDRPGNNRLDGMKNILANPKVGIIFMVPGANITYRVNGHAEISVDPDLLARFEVNGKPPRSVLVVTVEEAFNHCPKAFVRSKVWQAAADGPPEGVPSHGDFVAHRDGGDADYAAAYNEKYKRRLPDELY
jgi:hypothetical protein